MLLRPVGCRNDKLVLLLTAATSCALTAPIAEWADARAGRAGVGGAVAQQDQVSLSRGCAALSGALRLRGGAARPAGVSDAAARTARDVEKAMQLLEKARAGYAAAGVKPPGKLEQIDALNRLLAEDKNALINGDRGVLDKLEQTVGAPDPGAPQALALDSEEQQLEDWEAGVDKMKEEGDAILHEMRTGTKRGPDYNNWDEIPALRKAALMISEDSHHALWKAVRDQNADRLAYLLQHKKCSGHTRYDVNHMFPALWNSTLLHVAAECEDVEVATMLFTSGAHLEQRNRYYLHYLP